MIQSIELKNFKSIKKKYFPLRNLNVLLGLNGQGKSSFIQSLLLLRQSDRLSEGVLRLKGENVNIGSTRDALYQFIENTDGLSISLQFKEADTYLMKFGYEIDADIFKQENLPLMPANYIVQNKHQALFTNNFQYLTAQREEPDSVNRASYSDVVDGNSIGKYGQYTVHYLELRGSDNVVFENMLHRDSKIIDRITNEESINKSLIHQTNLWLGEISPGVSVLTSKISSDYVLLEYAFKQPTLGSTNKFKPENVGFGISYALHVIVALLSAREGELIIIENPESHIHPRGQAELGKLIARVAQNNVQVIIETHSDHILNGIRVAVKEKTIDKNNVIGFYFEKVVEASEQYSSITDIEIDRNGTLSDYPEGLLDEWSNQLSKLV